MAKKGGGGGFNIPSPEQQRQIELNNQLLETQVRQALESENKYKAENTPEAVAARKAAEESKRVSDATAAFTKSKGESRQSQLQSSTAALREAGLDQYIPDIVGRINADYDAYGYSDGADPSRLAATDYVSPLITGERTKRRDTAYGTAAATGKQRLEGMGLTDLLDEYETKLNDTRTNAGLSANTYTDIFNPDSLVDSVLGTERTNRRQGYQTAVNSKFSGLNPLVDFADTADDTYINDIVGTQYTDALNSLDRAKARGALNDTGYNRGLELLGTNRNAALTTANTLGGAVLTRNRDALSGIQTKARNEAAGWDFGKSFDPDQFLNEYTTKNTGFQANLGGEIANALQGQRFFDVGDILTKSGYAQGAQNTAPLTGGFLTPNAVALAEERKKTNTANRGLGGGSVF